MVVPYVVNQYQRRPRASQYTVMDVVTEVGKTLTAAAYAANTLSGGIKDFTEATGNLGEAMDSAAGNTSGGSRKTSEAGISVEPGNKKPKLTNIVQQTPVGFSSLNDPHRFRGIGGDATAVLGNKTAAPIQMKLGKQLSSTTSIENFLSLFNQTGTISSGFGGRLLVPQDERWRIFQCFRHNLHDESSSDSNFGTSTGKPYPSTAKILDVQGNMTVLGKTIPNAPFQDVDNGGVYFAPYNKADLEDVSFNLNKFKLGVQYAGSGNTITEDTADQGSTTVGMNPAGSQAGYAKQKIALLNDVTLMRGNQGSGFHRTKSAIYQNNARGAHWGSASSYNTAPYKYDAVLKQGTVDYLFMNKGIGPLVVEVVVYRVKQNGVQGVPSTFANLNMTNQLEKVISNGSYQKYLGGFGTDNLAPSSGINGTRSSTDWYTEPDLPYLPSCRQIDQSTLAYKEAQRIKICLRPGDRRPFQLKLGGEKYDPDSLTKKAYDSNAPSKTPIFDRHSYIVALVVNGMPQSRLLNLNTTSQAPQAVLGDCFCQADFQFTANYTEYIGAMSYKKCNARHLFTNGNPPSMHDSLTSYNNIQTLETNKFQSSPVIIMDQSTAVRTPAGSQVHGGAHNVFS